LTKKLFCNHDCRKEFKLRSADDNGWSLRARTHMRSGGRCEACAINVAGSQGLIWKAHRHATSTLAPGASRADYKAAYVAFFERNPKPEVARLAPFVRLRKETTQIQRGSLLQARAVRARSLKLERPSVLPV